MEHYINAWRNFANFDGRATRTQYWSFFGINFVIALVLNVSDNGGTLYLVYVLAIFIPALAYGVRRLHDAGYSGWWILLPIVNIFLLLASSIEGENRFGPPVA